MTSIYSADDLVSLQHFFTYAIKLQIDIGEVAREQITSLLYSKFIPSAVLVPFVHIDNELHILLTQRSTKLNSHAGQIAFPGGKMDKQDASFIETAIREAYEEVHILPKQIQTYGLLPKTVVPSGFEIHPVLAYLKENSWQANQTEVSSIFTVPASLALNPHNYKHEIKQYTNQDLIIYSLNFLQYKIWGATAHILYRLALSYENFKKTI